MRFPTGRRSVIAAFNCLVLMCAATAAAEPEPVDFVRDVRPIFEANCYDCHRKIDPPGFALENYDAIGNWRASYKGAGKIDAAGELPSGEAFSGIEEFKNILVQRREQFATALTAKLLAYATGRRIEAADRPQIERIVKELDARGNGFRDLVLLVATSEAFLAK